MKLLIISDIDNKIHYAKNEEKLSNLIKDIKNYEFDVVVTMGNIPKGILLHIYRSFPNKKCIGVQGNDDKADILTLCGILNLHCRNFNIKNIEFAGFGGDLRKAYCDIDEETFRYTQDQCYQLMDSYIENCDILITHINPLHTIDNKYNISTPTGVLEFMEKRPPKLCVYNSFETSISKYNDIDMIGLRGINILDVNSLDIVNIYDINIKKAKFA